MLVAVARSRHEALRSRTHATQRGGSRHRCRGRRRGRWHRRRQRAFGTRRDRTAAPWRAISNGSGAEIMLARRTTSFGLIGPRSTLAPRPGRNRPIPGTRATGPFGRVFSRAAPCPRDEGRRHELGLFGPHRREHDPPLRLDALPCGQHRHDGDPLELELRLNAQDAAHLRPVLEQLARDHTARFTRPRGPPRPSSIVPGRGQFNLQTPRHADGQPTASASTTGIPAPESVLAAARPLASYETPDREPDPPGAKMAVAQGTSRLLRQPPGTLNATREPAAGERIEHGRISGGEVLVAFSTVPGGPAPANFAAAGPSVHG